MIFSVHMLYYIQEVKSMSIGENIKQLRQLNNLTQEELLLNYL